MDKVSSLGATRADNLVNSPAYKVYKVEPRRALKRTSSFDDSETDSEDELTVRKSSFSKPGDRGSITAKNIKRPLVRKAAAALKVSGNSKLVTDLKSNCIFIYPSYLLIHLFIHPPTDASIHLIPSFSGCWGN